MPSDGLQWNVSGLKELDSRLKDLPNKIQAKALRQAVGAGGRVFRDDARSRVDSRTGNLVNAIRYTTSVKTSEGYATAKVFVSNKKAWYGRLVEFGTLPHQIFAGKLAKSQNYLVRRAVFGSPAKKENRFQYRTADKRAQALNILGNFVEKVDHPGAKPHPFMHAAVNKAQEAVDAVAAKLRQFLDSYKPNG